MSPGTLTSFIIYTLSVAVGLGTVTSLYGDLMKAVGTLTSNQNYRDRLVS